MENTCCCCQGKTKHRTPEEQKKLLNRLCRIEGQVRGLQEMLQKDAYCPDILIQVSAVGAALNSFSKELLATPTSAPAWRMVSDRGTTRSSTSW